MNRDNPPPSRSSSPRLLRLGLLGLALAGVPLAKAQAILSASEQAGPGAEISVRGDALDSNARFTIYPYTTAGARGTGVSVASDTTNAAGTVATVHLPRTLPNTVYEIAASTSKGTTNSVFINRARMQWTDVPDVMPGQTVRIVGRNFTPFAGATPTVTLTNASTRTVYTPTITSVTDSVIKVQVPAAAPAGTYAIALNNGVAGSASADPATQALTIRAAANDPFSLGVAWGADFVPLLAKTYNAKTDPRLPAHPVGDGSTFDGQNIAVDLYWMYLNGGGVLQLPAGTYRIDDGNVQAYIYGGTVLQGAGRGQTILQVGMPFHPGGPTPDYHSPLALYGTPGPSGICDLTVQNLSTSSTPNNVLTALGSPHEVFLKRVDLQMGNGVTTWMQSASKVMIADSNFTSTSMVQGTLTLKGASEFQYVRNTEYHRACRLVFNLGARGVVEGNTIQFDNNYRNASTAETGGVELSWAQQVLVGDNQIGALGAAPNRPAVDGEAILTQIGQNGDFMYTGMVRSATSRILIPTTAFPNTTWQDPGSVGPTSRMAILIISGKGMGQWRRATSWASGSVSLDQAWQITPDSTSRFAITTLNNYQQTYSNNQLFGGFYGVEWEHGAIDSVAEGNTLTNTGMMGVIAYTMNSQNGWGAAGSNYSFTAAWNNAFLKNTLINTTGVRAANISVSGIDCMNLNLGPLALGNDVRGNTIVGNFYPASYGEYGCNDGIEVCGLDENVANNGNSMLVQGTVLQDNPVSNSSTPVLIYNLSSGNGFLSNTSTAASS